MRPGEADRCRRSRSRAVSRIFCAGTITPRSTTSKLLHWSTTPTMFLPMSCTSPLTVAITILPFGLRRVARRRLLLLDERHRGARPPASSRAPTFTTCGRNILPAPKRSPTTFMPSISGPSITWIGRAVLAPRLLGVLDDEVAMPLHQRVREPLLDACRRATRGPRLASLRLRLDTSRRTSTRRSVASGRRLSTTSSTRSRRSGRDLVVDAELAGVDDAHRQPGADRVVEEHRVDRLAHRVVAAEGEGDVARRRRDTLRVRQVLADPARRLDEVDARSCCAPRCRSRSRRCSGRR